MVEAALGIIPFDVLLTNLKIVNVYTEEIIEGTLGIKDGKIAAVSPTHCNAKEIIDCNNKYAVPGFIDAHMHIETSHLNPTAWAELTIPHGTTAIFADPMMLANVSGEKGIGDFNKMIQDIPMHAYIQIPSRIPASENLETSGGELTPQRTGKLLIESNVASLGEVNAGSVLSLQNSILEKMVYAKEHNKIINGHYPAPSWNGLNGLVASGVGDDHESISYEELKQKLSLGLVVMVREGSMEPNLEPLIQGVVADNLPTDNLIFCSDDKHPSDLLEHGHIDHSVKKAISLGLPPTTAIKMATLQPAKYFGLDREIGSLTPGRWADILLCDNLEDMSITQVYHKGVLVAENGEIREQLLMDYERYYHELCNSIVLPSELKPDNLGIKTENSSEKILAISVKQDQLIVSTLVDTLSSENGMLKADTQKDILPISVIERYGKSGNIGCGFIHGLQLKKGAVGCSMAQESNNVVVAGCSYEDMHIAAKELEQIGGGMVVVLNGELAAVVKMPLAGIMCTCSAKEYIRQQQQLIETLEKLGCTNKSIFSHLSIATCTTIPKLGLSDYGLIDVDEGKLISSML